MRVNSVKLNNYKNNQNISFKSNSVNEYPKMTQFEQHMKLPSELDKAAAQPKTFKVVLIKLIKAIKQFIQDKPSLGKMLSTNEEIYEQMLEMPVTYLL
jgi:hypothetical protein